MSGQGFIFIVSMIFVRRGTYAASNTYAALEHSVYLQY